MTCVRVERRASIVKVRLNRPEKMNAINSTMEKEFYSVLADCDRLDDVKCVVLTAEGAISHPATTSYRLLTRQSVERNRRPFRTSTGCIPAIFFPVALFKGTRVATKGYVGPHANTFLLAADV